MRDPSDTYDDTYDGNQHQKVWEILPWYVNGTLEGPEHEIVARHILTCQACAEEIERCQSIATVVRSDEEIAWTPSPKHFAQLIKRIERGSTSAAPKRWWIRVREWIEKIRLAFQETPSFSRWALAAQTAAIVLLAAAIILEASRAPSLLYRTLSDTGSGPEPGRVHLQVVFADDITERKIRELLSSIRATIVAGPSPMAVYTIALTADDHEAPALTRETLAVLRAHPKVRLAEAKYQLRILSLLAAVVVLTAGCGSLALREGVDEEGEALPRQLRARQVIVTLAPATPEVWATLAKELSGEYGLDQVGAFPLTSLGVQCVVFQVSENRPLDTVLAQLTVDPRVESVQQNQFFQSLQALAGDPYASLQYGPRAVRADRAHAWVTGRGVRVAVVDTGVDTNHPDLTDRVAKTINFVEGGEKTFTADHHGTAVAGVIGARADNGMGIYGIAPGAELLAVKACWHRRTGNPEAWCSSWTLAKAIDFAIIERVQVLNLSLSGPPDPLLRRLIVKAVEKQNMTVVAAVMERGDPALSFPSSLSTVIAVVASDAQGSVRARVGKHPAPLAAPGIEVLTTVPNGAYDFLSGSSFATAHVSGIVALLLEGNPQLSPREVRDLVLDSGRPVNRKEAEAVPIRHVDACAALQLVVHKSCS